MRNLSWKFGIALLTFSIGTILVLAWLTFSNKSPESVDVSLPLKSENLSLAPIVAENSAKPKSVVVSNNTQITDKRKKQPIHFIKNGGELCENYLLKTIAKENFDGNQVSKLKNFNPDDETLSPELREWLDTSIHLDMLVAFELRDKKNKALLLRANIAGATGIAANFTNWFIQLDNRSIIFRSLSENPKLIFRDRNGLINYYSIGYGEAFLQNRDWENLTVDLEQYRISSDGSTELVRDEQNVKCE